MSSLTTTEAIHYVMEFYNIPSYYRLARNLSDEYLAVQGIQISNYLNGKSMSRKVANRFLAIFDIVIIDVFEYTRKDNYRI